MNSLKREIGEVCRKEREKMTVVKAIGRIVLFD